MLKEIIFLFRRISKKTTKYLQNEIIRKGIILKRVQSS